MYSLNSELQMGTAQPRIQIEPPVWEQALFVLWFFLLTTRMPQLSSLLALCLLAILGLFVVHANRTIPCLIKAWPILLYPLLGLLSAGWSTYPAEALNQGIFLIITPFVFVTLAVRLNPKIFFRCLTLSGALATLYFAQPSVQFHGPNAVMHKQFLAYLLLLIAIPAFVSAMNNNELRVIRIVGLITSIAAFSLQFVADSVTSIGLTSVAFIIILGAKLIWLPAARVRHFRSLIFLTACGVVCLAALAVLSLPQNSVIEDSFALVGKDTTLTGRTMIWEFARIASETDPIFGQGLGAFWHQDVGIAASLAEATHATPGANISFHSVYWETRVHLGWVGLAVVCFALIWSILINVREWIQRPSILTTGMMVLMLVTASTFATESYLVGPFDMVPTAFYIGALSAIARSRDPILVPRT